jgi:hypothetical protein
MAISKLEYLLTILYLSGEEIKATSNKIQGCKKKEGLRK